MNSRHIRSEDRHAHSRHVHDNAGPYPYTVISLGGSLFSRKEGEKIVLDSHYMREFLTTLQPLTEQGNRFVVITGGGQNARVLQNQLAHDHNLSHESLDRVGIMCTRLHAQVLLELAKQCHFFNLCQDVAVLEEMGLEEMDPEGKGAGTSVSRGYSLIISGGFKPGMSTDAVSLNWAIRFNASRIVNLSNITHVYDREPSDKNAIPLESMTWAELRALVGSRWAPGLHVPFDPIACKLAESHGANVYIASGKNLATLVSIVRGEPFVGTKIS